jgi:aspartate/methionine/tyrosine aminotransferase
MQEGRELRLTGIRGSVRAAQVQRPVIPIVAGWISETPGTISLGQGVASYGPPPAALKAISDFPSRPGSHLYKPDAGEPDLRRALEEKLRGENGIDAPFEKRIIVTAGANQAFLNAVLVIADPGDEILLPVPYYFNHEMAVRLSGCRPIGIPTDEDFRPRLDLIADAVTERTRAVVTVSPNNPTGAVYAAETLSAVNRFCASKGIYHISDEAYEYFTYDGAAHFSPGSLGGSDHTISLFSFSKAYGMASWRVGYMAAPEHLFEDLIKIQDTVIVCAPAVSQALALDALKEGRSYCASRLESIAKVRDLVSIRLGACPELLRVPPAQGAFYFLAKVRTEMNDLELVERLIREHKVAVIPGGAFGVSGGCCLRISYGNLSAATASEGIDRLVRGLRAILGERGEI